MLLVVLCSRPGSCALYWWGNNGKLSHYKTRQGHTRDSIQISETDAERGLEDCLYHGLLSVLVLEVEVIEGIMKDEACPCLVGRGGATGIFGIGIMEVTHSGYLQIAYSKY